MMTSHSEPLLITAYPTEFPDSFGEDRRAMVRQIFDSMKLAYGSQFGAQLRSANKPNNPTAFDWRCHLLKISQPYTAEQVLDAFDQCMTASHDWPPTLQRILAQMQINALDEKRRTADEERLRHARESRGKIPIPDNVFAAMREAAKGVQGREGRKLTAEETAEMFRKHQELVGPITKRAQEAAIGRFIPWPAWEKIFPVGGNWQ